VFPPPHFCPPQTYGLLYKAGKNVSYLERYTTFAKVSFRVYLILENKTYIFKDKKMENNLKFWEQNPEFLNTKSLSQILSFIGDGKLRDNNSTSAEFRQLLGVVPTEILKKYVDNCLTDKFDNNNGGYALQDVINQIGERFGYTIKNGLYQGKQDAIGFDGIWTSDDGYSFIIEVKTTDAYRINLDVIADYRKKLILKNEIEKDKSSILIIVGRQDTGDLEAQIRGSKHAWDIRLLSSDSLVKLLVLKETLNDIKTMQQINEILKPYEYTRIDKLIDLLFITSQDIQFTNDEIVEENIIIDDNQNKKQEHLEFTDLCIIRIQEYLKTTLIKETRASFVSRNDNLGVLNIISKLYGKNNDEKYWFGFHPHQKVFLNRFEKSFICFGCGSPELIFVIPYKIFEPLLDNMNITEKKDRMYWHVFISQNNGKYYIHQTLSKINTRFEISEYRI